MVLRNMCIINSQYVNNRNTNNKQLVNSENWFLYESVTA